MSFLDLQIIEPIFYIAIAVIYFHFLLLFPAKQTLAVAIAAAPLVFWLAALLILH